MSASLYQNAETKELYNYMYELEARGYEIIGKQPFFRYSISNFYPAIKSNQILFAMQMSAAALTSTSQMQITIKNDLLEEITLSNDLVQEKANGDLIYSNNVKFLDIPFIEIVNVSNIQYGKIIGWIITVDKDINV